MTPDSVKTPADEAARGAGRNGTKTGAVQRPETVNGTIADDVVSSTPEAKASAVALAGDGPLPNFAAPPARTPDRDQVRALQDTVDAAELERARLREALEAANLARARLLEALQLARRQKVELRAALEAQTAKQRAALEAEIGRLRESLKESTDDRVRLRAAREAWFQERKQFQQERATLKESLATIQRSRSWRMTRPLRVLARAFLRLFGKAGPAATAQESTETPQ